MTKKHMLYILAIIDQLLVNDEDRVPGYILTVYDEHGTHFVSNMAPDIAKELLTATTTSFANSGETLQ